MPYDYPTKSLEIQTRLISLGLQPTHLMMIGSFITVYGLFETTLERSLWALREIKVEGERPFTEKMNTAAQFKMLGDGNPKLTDKCNAILKVAAHAARDLNEYRNSLVHGYLLSFGPDSVPSFLKNPRWHGEDRKKAAGDAYIDEPFQDLVLIAAWNLFVLVRNVEKVFTDPKAWEAIEAMKEDVERAKSYANETRHLASLMNHDKN
ncbi:hypothetical protein FM038_013350 [Shewanella eurypsychrophilus]|uniref:Uncharacterized protein n=1 Tax=Shewanella eurypsychrophilus TaxID=2593656 RepID=A0ABX6V6T5_9GAMM|nr:MULTISPECIES: hypothetical protein [Shewanella]QFU23039.1 hypothetical protein FS418_14930 [Shewanella sp. YLB-09]QPG58322.1 hypothetical protein FM038_013350 [Shewanella eurypsychrophilus]